MADEEQDDDEGMACLSALLKGERKEEEKKPAAGSAEEEEEEISDLRKEMRKNVDFFHGQIKKKAAAAATAAPEAPVTHPKKPPTQKINVAGKMGVIEEVEVVVHPGLCQDGAVQPTVDGDLFLAKPVVDYEKIHLDDDSCVNILHVNKSVVTGADGIVRWEDPFQQQQQTHWEYLSRWLPDFDFESRANELGREGWELVAVCFKDGQAMLPMLPGGDNRLVMTGGAWCFFKRPKKKEEGQRADG